MGNLTITAGGNISACQSISPFHVVTFISSLISSCQHPSYGKRFTSFAFYGYFAAMQKMATRTIVPHILLCDWDFFLKFVSLYYISSDLIHSFIFFFFIQ